MVVRFVNLFLNWPMHLCLGVWLYSKSGSDLVDHLSMNKGRQLNSPPSSQLLLT